MKKATILMALVLLLSVCGVGVLAADVFEAHDQVVLTEKTVYGDRSKADGLTVQINSHYRSRLQWSTSLQIDDEAECKTDYSFSAKQRRTTRPVEYDGLNMNNYVMESLNFRADEPQEGLWVEYKKLLDETQPGQEGEIDVRLKDHMSHYPIGINLDFPNATLSTDTLTDRERLDELEALHGSEVYAIQRLRDYFKIPILDDEYLSIHVRKREDGTQGGWGGGTSQYGDRYDMSDYSALSDTACYFTIETLTNDGKTIDTSEIPGGYGIYRLPYHMEYDKQRKEDVGIIDADGLEMVYPLTPGIDIAYLSLNTAQTCLYLHTVEDGTYFITVIDLSSMEQMQKLELIHFDDEPYWTIVDQDDFIVIEFNNTLELGVISKAESGALTLEYICPMRPEGVDTFFLYNAAVDFDGERLVMAQQLDIEFSNEPDYRDRTSCGLQVMVYEKDGLAFMGEYTSSLDTGEDWTDHAFYVQGDHYEPVITTWNC